MTGAMYAAIAGLKTHMSKLNVIGNNIANVNTNGYKSQRTIFKDAMYTMYSSGSDGTTTTGGKNPSQVGYGSQISSIDLNMSTGSYAPGTALDCMIYGDGFFLVGDKTIADVIDPLDPNSVKSLNLTRVGDFSFKADGYLCDGNGSTVYGFLTTGVDPVTGNPIVSDQLVPIRLPKMETVYRDDQGEIKTKTEYDAVTDPAEKAKWTINQEVKFPVDKTDDDAYTALKDYAPEVEDGQEPADLPFITMDSISINPETGAITGTTRDTGELITIGFLALGNVTNPNGVTHDGGFYYTAGEGAGDLQVSLMGGVAKDLGIKSVNGSLYDAAKEAAGDTVPAEATQSEKMLIGSAGGTNLMTGGLEGSNVDLAAEISELITTQRGYQANTRIITVTDSMLEELVNMKR